MVVVGMLGIEAQKLESSYQERILANELVYE